MSRIDPDFVKGIKATSEANNINLQTLINEVERLELLLESIKKAINPQATPDDQALVMVQNLVKAHFEVINEKAPPDATAVLPQ